MSLNNINLSPYLIAQLYQNVLIEEDKLKTFAQAETTTDWKYLGNNAKNVLVAVNYQQVTHLPDEQLDFLSKIINSCKLSMEDICLLNLHNYPNVAYDVLLKSLTAVLFCFLALQPTILVSLSKYRYFRFSNMINIPSFIRLRYRI